MKKYFTLFIALVPMVCFASVPITEDFTKAKDLAQAYDRPIVLLFTGSDWCQWSKKILNDVINTEDFEEAVGKNFIFAKIDFPEINTKSGACLEQNKGLKEEFEIDSFPTIVMTNQRGREITRMGYVEGCPERVASKLSGLLNDYQTLSNDVENCDFSKVAVEEVEELYNRAKILQCPYYLDKILEAGIQTDKGVFFPLEKYTSIVNEGLTDSDEAMTLREAIIRRDPDNEQQTRLRLALLDFQSQDNDPESAIKPLGSYIKNFGTADKDNLWRLHLVISEYFSLHGNSKEAKEHAEKSFTAAPEAEKSNIENVLKVFNDQKIPSFNAEMKVGDSKSLSQEDLLESQIKNEMGS